MQSNFKLRQDKEEVYHAKNGFGEIHWKCGFLFASGFGKVFGVKEP